jgi:hypothetical protein
VEAAEADRLLRVVEERIATGQTGARGQRATLEALERAGASREAALAAMLERYMACAASGEPVHRWPV